MNSIKTLVTLAILAAIGVALYVKINAPDPEPPKEATGTFDGPPPVEMGSLGAPIIGTAPGTPNGGSAAAPTPGSTAPAFAPGGAPPAFVPGGAAPPFKASVPAAKALTPPPAAKAPAFDPRPGSEPAAATSNSAARPTTDPFVQKVTASAPAETPSPRTYHDVSAQARLALDRGELATAHLMLSEWYRDPSLDREAQYDLTTLLGRLAGTVIYSNEHYLEPAYRPAAGETLEQIATRYAVSAELLAKINGLSVVEPLPANRELKVVRGPFMAVIDVPQREMILVLAGRYAGRFTIGMGKEAAGADGEYKVVKKYVNPTYYGADEIVQPEDPRNPLGEYWLSLGKPLENAAAGPLGIHSTNDPASINQDLPRTFIRLLPNDAEDAYDILTVGSTVLVRQ